MSCSGDYCPISRCPKSSNTTRALLGGGVAAVAYAAYCYFKRPATRPVPARFTVFVGCLAHSLSLQQPLQLLERAALVVDRQSGLIVRMVPEVTDLQIQTLLAEFKSQGPVELRRLSQHQFLVPGFIDTHTHAPQSAFAGTGRIPLLEWLLKYTFPTECKFQDLSFANHIYSRCVRRVLWSGTTTCCYYGTIHTEATVLLAKLAAKAGQRAFVGKVCMDRNAPDYYCEESAAASAQATRDFVQQVQALDSKLVVPIITPRFAPTCSSELMIELGNIAREHSLPIQTHVSENKSEIDWVRSLHPDCASYTDVYHRHGLLTDRTVLAHGIHLQTDERQLIRQTGASIAHCANSNYSLDSGIMDVRQFLNEGLKIGLGTDVAGGYSASMLNAIREAIIASKSLAFSKWTEDGSASAAEYKPLSYEEAFYLATLGGAQAVGMSDRIGNFLVGKSFDALLIDATPNVPLRPFDVFEADFASDVFQKFIFLGDDRNIAEIYVNGKKLDKDALAVDA